MTNVEIPMSKTRRGGTKEAQMAESDDRLPLPVMPGGPQSGPLDMASDGEKMLTIADREGLDTAWWRWPVGAVRHVIT